MARIVIFKRLIFALYFECYLNRQGTIKWGNELRYWVFFPFFTLCLLPAGECFCSSRHLIFFISGLSAFYINMWVCFLICCFSIWFVPFFGSHMLVDLVALFYLVAFLVFSSRWVLCFACRYLVWLLVWSDKST